MFGEVAGNVHSKMNDVVVEQKKLYKSLSKLIGDAITDYNLIDNMGASDDGDARLATNYIQVMAVSKKYVDKLMEANIELAAAIDGLTEKQKDQNEKLDKIIKLLEKKN